MSRGAGPFITTKATADTTITTKPARLETYTITNASGAAVTVTFYDDPAGGSNIPVEQVIVAAGASLMGRPKIDTLNGLVVKASLWTSLQVFARWAPV